jgi:hypothetical protein
MSDFDSPWKEMLDHFFRDFAAFAWPEAEADINWTRDPESLETEMRKLHEEAEVGPRRVDKLVKAYTLPDGEEAYLHVEVQSQQEPSFAHRMDTYNSRAEERYRHPAASLAVLGDDSPDWRPTTYHYEKWGCRKTFTFVTVKLLDWRGREEELEGHANPFAVFVLAHLQALATRRDEKARAASKLRLAGNFIARRLGAADLRQWLRYLDWLLTLPPEVNRQVWERINQSMKENIVPFIDYYQQLEIDAEKRGEQRGVREGLLQGIALALELKFAAEGQRLLPDVQRQTDTEGLRRFLDAIRTAGGIDELRTLLP